MGRSGGGFSSGNVTGRRAQLDLAYGPKPPNPVVAEFVEEPDRHHYDVIDGLADPNIG